MAHPSMSDKGVDNRFEPDGNRNYDIQRVWDNHHEITRRLVAGEKPRNIASDLGITTQTVSNVRNNPLLKRLFHILHSAADVETVEIRKRIVELGPQAISYLENAMQIDIDGNTKSAVGLGAAKTVIENILPKVIHTSSDETHTVKIINELKEKAKAIGAFEEVEEGEFELVEEGGKDEEVAISNSDASANSRS